MSASARLEAFEKVTRGAISVLKLEWVSIDAACRPGADPKSFSALFRMVNFGAHGRIVEDNFLRTRRSIFQPGSAHVEDVGTAGKGCSGAGWHASRKICSAFIISFSTISGFDGPRESGPVSCA